MLRSPDHTHTDKQMQANFRILDNTKVLLHTMDDKIKSNFDDLHAKSLVYVKYWLMCEKRWRICVKGSLVCVKAYMT